MVKKTQNCDCISISTTSHSRLNFSLSDARSSSGTSTFQGKIRQWMLHHRQIDLICALIEDSLTDQYYTDYVVYRCPKVLRMPSPPTGLLQPLRGQAAALYL